MEIIASTGNGRKDKNDTLLQELVNARNWKQAVANCEKRARKGEKSDGFLVNKAHILICHPDQARQEQGAAELDAILERRPPITDVSILTAIENVAKARGDQHPHIFSIWDRAAAARPEDEQLQEKWFKKSFERKDFRAAQKAAMILQKNFPKKRAPFFWAIVANHLASTAPDVTDLDRRLFGPLAYKMLSKAAADVPRELKSSKSSRDDLETSDQNNSTTNSLNIANVPRSLRDSGDLRLLLEIYRSQCKFEEALAILDDPRTGITSRIGSNAWDLVRAKIELFEECEFWEREWQFCYDILLDACPQRSENPVRRPNLTFGSLGDDWKVWFGLLTSCKRIHTEDNSALTRELIELYEKTGKASRNSRLASITFSLTADANSQNKLFLTCFEFFKSYSKKNVCFHDLECYVHRLQKPLQGALLDRIAEFTRSVSPQETDSEAFKTAWIISEINTLKFDYSLIVSRRDTQESPDLLSAFVGNCLRLYKLSLPIGSQLPASERRPGDDAAILAAMALIHLRKMGRNKALLQSAVVLEFLLSHSKHNYDALLIIIRVYLCLGATSLAMKHYAQLNIKNTQYSTLSWILYTRLSTVHPHGFSSKVNTRKGSTSFDLVHNLKLALNWHDATSHQLNSGIDKLLSDGASCNLLSHLKLTEVFENSFTKFLLVVEFHRITRLLNAAGTEKCRGLMEDLLHPLYDTLEEDRDLAVFPNYEPHDQAQFEEQLRAWPHPGKRWLALQIHLLSLAELFTESPLRVNTYILSTLEEDRYEDKMELTGAEVSAAMAVKIMETGLAALFACLERDDPKEVSVQLELALRHLGDWLSFIANQAANSPNKAFELSPRLFVPNSVFLHVIFVTVDICLLIDNFMVYVNLVNTTKKRICEPKWLQKKTLEVVTLIKQILTEYRRAASWLRNQFQMIDFPREISELCLGSPFTAAETVETGIVEIEMRQLIGEVWMETMSLELLASWQDSLDGVLRTKTKM